jgi:hypothetical protein
MTCKGEPLVTRLYSLDEPVEMRRHTLRFAARHFPSHAVPGQGMAADSHAARLASSVTDPFRNEC